MLKQYKYYSMTYISGLCNDECACIKDSVKLTSALHFYKYTSHVLNWISCQIPLDILIQNWRALLPLFQAFATKTFIGSRMVFLRKFSSKLGHLKLSLQADFFKLST